MVFLQVASRVGQRDKLRPSRFWQAVMVRVPASAAGLVRYGPAVAIAKHLPHLRSCHDRIAAAASGAMDSHL